MEVSRNEIIQEDVRQSRRSLLLGVLVWFLHQNTIYGLSSLSCKWSWFPYTIAGIPGAQFVQGLITLIALLLMAYLIYLPWRIWRRYQTEKPADNPHLMQDTEKDPRPMVAFIAMMLNFFFILFVISNFAPMLALSACSQG